MLSLYLFIMRCFVAVDISDSLKPEIVKVQKMIDYEGISMVPSSNLHITLKFLGDINEYEIHKIDELLKSIKYNEFTVDICSFGAFPNMNIPKILWLGLDSRELIVLAGIVENKLHEQGFARSDKPFSAHLTIARIKQSIKIYNIDSLRNVNIGRQVVSSFCLKQSTFTPSDPVYTNINQYKLR